MIDPDSRHGREPSRLASLLRANVTQTLKDSRLDADAAHRQLFASQSRHNVHAVSIVFGILIALLSTLFAWNAAQRHGTQHTPRALPTSPTASGEHWIDISDLEP